MRAFMTHSLVSLLFVSIIFCASTKESVFKLVLETAKEHVRLRAPYYSIFELRELLQKRVELFFTSVNIMVFPGPLKTTSEPGISRKKDKEESTSLCPLDKPILPKSSNTHDYPLISIADDPIQSYSISACIDLSTFKADSPPLMGEWVTEIFTLNQALNGVIIPSGKPLNKLSKHTDAPYIYHRLFRVFSAYRNVMLDFFKPYLRLGHFEGSATKMFEVYNRHCWDVLLPGGSQSIYSASLPISSIQTLNYRVGQFVKKGTLFATTKNDIPKPEEHDFILLSYKFEEESLVYTKLHIHNSSELDPPKQALADDLIRAYRDGLLSMETHEMNYGLLKIIYTTAKTIMDDSKVNPPPYLPSYHPYEFKADVNSNILARTDNHGRELALVTSNGFESANVRKRVLQGELSMWWNTFIPGSRVLFLSPSEEDTVIPEHHHPFRLLPPFPSNTVASREVYSVLRGTKGPCFFSKTLVFSKCTQDSTAIIQCPRTPILHDKERIQKLLDLASKHHDH